MIQSFSPREITTLIQPATTNNNSLRRRILAGGSYRSNFKELLGLIDPGMCLILLVPHIISLLAKYSENIIYIEQ